MSILLLLERVLALESREGTRASRRVEEPTGGCSPTDLASPPPPAREFVAVSRVLRFCGTCCLPRTSGNVRFSGRGRSARACWALRNAQRRRGQGEAEVVSGSPKSFPVRSWVLASPRAGNDQNLRCRGLGPLGLLALLGVRVHWPEFWGSGHCSPLVNASAITHPRG